jgi:hypothetical protein
MIQPVYDVNHLDSGFELSTHVLVQALPQSQARSPNHNAKTYPENTKIALRDVSGYVTAPRKTRKQPEENHHHHPVRQLSSLIRLRKTVDRQ